MAKILHKDEHCIIVSKEPGELVMSTGDTEAGLVKELEKSHGPVYPVNRLDRPTSGLVLFARHKKAARDFSALFSKRQVCKIYWLIPDSPPLLPYAELVHYIAENKKLNKSYALEEKKKGTEYAKMAFQVIGSGRRYVFVVARLYTGRHHQIRAQMAAYNSPLKGDVKYGSRRTTSFGGIYLHSAFLAFVHPFTGEKIAVFTAPHSDALWTEFLRQEELFMEKHDYRLWEDKKWYEQLYYAARKSPDRVVSLNL